MVTGTIEERLARVEARLDELIGRDTPEAPEEITDARLDEAEFMELVRQMQRKSAQRPRPTPTTPDWLERNAGIFANDPTWDRFVAYLQEQSDREYADANRRTGQK